MKHRPLFFGFTLCALFLFDLTKALSVTANSGLDRYILIGTILDQSGTLDSKNVAVLEDKGQASKRITLSRGDLLPDGSMKVTAINRNEVVLFDGHKTHLITYTGRSGPVPTPTSEGEESAMDRFSALGEAMESSPMVQSRGGDYHYEMKDGIYILVKDPLPAEGEERGAAVVTESSPNEEGVKQAEGSAPFNPSVIASSLAAEIAKFAQDKGEVASGPTPFRHTPLAPPLVEENLESWGEQDGSVSCEDSETCAIAEPTEMEEIPYNSESMDDEG